MTGSEFKAKAKEVIETCKRYGFMGRMIFPYGFRITVAEFTRNWKDYDRCTPESQGILESELNGFLPILEGWIEYENEPMIVVKLISGKHAGEVKELHESTARDFIEAGIAIAI